MGQRRDSEPMSRLVLRAMQVKESAPGLTNWSSIPDVIQHGAGAFSRFEIAAVTARLVREGLARRTEVTGQIRFRLTDKGRMRLEELAP